MKKLIFKKFIQEVLKFFITALITISLIVWVIQATNYFDIVMQDGHGLEVYFKYTLFNFPKIVNKLFLFVFFISLFLVIISYEKKNELNIFWTTGISKINFSKKLIFFSLIVMLIQLILSSYISPKSQFKSRLYLKNSNVDFFTSLLKEAKFINVAKNLTIFINKQNLDGTYTNIFIDDNTNNNSRIIYAKEGVIVSNNKEKSFQLYKGKVLDKKKNITSFDFDQIGFDLTGLASSTILAAKIQEIDTITLLNCFINFKQTNNLNYQSFNCDKKISKEIKRELLSRVYKPIYIPVITFLCCFVFLFSKFKINYNKCINLIFLIVFFILIISEISVKYAPLSLTSFLVYILLPWIIFIISTISFKFLNRNV